MTLQIQHHKNLSHHAPSSSSLPSLSLTMRDLQNRDPLCLFFFHNRRSHLLQSIHACLQIRHGPIDPRLEIPNLLVGPHLHRRRRLTDLAQRIAEQIGTVVQRRLRTRIVRLRDQSLWQRREVSEFVHCDSELEMEYPFWISFGENVRHGASVDSCLRAPLICRSVTGIVEIFLTVSNILQQRILFSRSHFHFQKNTTKVSRTETTIDHLIHFAT
ncbi:uncharacterized protein LOC130789119 [Actinidia eriantha]|uniref:uncharacterized protein LOC130789119 n=1 Tax=Actinidia eriantha TaxID=165200 RepID=UPI00258E0F4B|nr:uncharacterized protein LOC130789119 [Actinidia eriantha]